MRSRQSNGSGVRAGLKEHLLPCLLLPLLAACAQTPDRIAFAEPVPSASVQKIYVTSGKLPSIQMHDLKQDRTSSANFAQYDVSVPRTHALGQIEWPDGVVDPRTDFAVVGQENLGSSEALIKAIQGEAGNEVTLFIHGYNNTPSEALYRFAQIGHDFEIDTPRILFAWPSAGTATGYIYDRDSVLFSRDPLANLLTDIARKTNKEITLIAHSMGAHLTMEVLRQIAITGRRDVLDDLRVVALLAPDIDPDIFANASKRHWHFARSLRHSDQQR